MSQVPNQLGKGVIQIDGDLDPLKAKLVEARKLVDEAGLAPGSVSPGGVAPTTPGGAKPAPAPATPGGPSPLPDPVEIDKGREATERADKATEKFIETTRDGGEPMRGFDMSLRNMTNGYVRLVGAIGSAVAAGLALRAVFEKIEGFTINQARSTLEYSRAIREAANSLEYFQQFQSKQLSTQMQVLGLPPEQIELALRNKSIADDRTKESLAALNEFDESKFGQTLRDTGAAYTLAKYGPIWAGYKLIERSRLQSEYESDVVEGLDEAQALSDITKRPGRHANRAQKGVNVLLSEIAETNGEMLKTEKFMEATKPR